MNIDTSSNESWTRSICKRLCEDLRLFKQDKNIKHTKEYQKYIVIHIFYGLKIKIITMILKR